MESAKRQSGSEYDQLLAQAKQAQASVDRAIDELHQIQRFLADGPTIVAARRQAAEQAQKALADAEAKCLGARESLTAKQVEVARLMEAAAGCQQALARCLAPGQNLPDLTSNSVKQAPESLSSAPVVDAMADSNKNNTNLTSDSWSTTYAFPTQPSVKSKNEDTNLLAAKVIDFLKDRDVLCPSCGTPLRAVAEARCPNCRMSLSLQVLKTTGPRGSTKLMWSIRIASCIALLMSLYLALSTATGRTLIGCGVGSSCDAIFYSGYGKMMGIPVAVFGAILYAAIALATFFPGIGRRDQTRQRGWTALSVLAAMAGGAAVWLLVVQFVLVGGICPHCLVVDAIGLLIAVLVLTNAPLMARAEKIPEDAIGPITLSKGRTLVLMATAMVCVGLFAGMHAAFKAPAQQRRQRPVTQDPDTDPNKGLMMGGLNLREKKDDDSDAKGVTKDAKGSAKENATDPDGKKPPKLIFSPVPIKSKDSKSDDTKKQPAKDTPSDSKSKPATKKPADKKPAKIFFAPLPSNPTKANTDDSNKQPTKDTKAK